MAIGKVAPNGTLNENGAFYSVQDVNTLLGGGVIPKPIVSDAGKAMVVGKDGKYTLGEVGGGDNAPFIVTVTIDYDYGEAGGLFTNKTYNEIKTALLAGKVVLFHYDVENMHFGDIDNYYSLISIFADEGYYNIYTGQSNHTHFSAETPTEPLLHDIG